MRLVVLVFSSLFAIFEGAISWANIPIENTGKSRKEKKSLFINFVLAVR